MTFVLAGAYNIISGLCAVADPQWLFRLAEMPLSNTPQIFASAPCSAFVVQHAASNPNKA